MGALRQPRVIFWRPKGAKDKKKRAAKRFCVKKAATRILKRVAAMEKLPKAEDFTLRGVDGALVQRAADEVEAPRRPGGILGGRVAGAKNDSHGGRPGYRHRKKSRHGDTPRHIRQCTFRGALVAERI